MLDFMIQYSAGLILTAQPLYALKLLAVAIKKSETAEEEETLTESNIEENITNKGIILALTGSCVLSHNNFKLPRYSISVSERPWRISSQTNLSRPLFFRGCA